MRAAAMFPFGSFGGVGGGDLKDVKICWKSVIMLTKGFDAFILKGVLICSNAANLPLRFGSMLTWWRHTAAPPHQWGHCSESRLIGGRRPDRDRWVTRWIVYTRLGLLPHRVRMDLCSGVSVWCSPRVCGFSGSPGSSHSQWALRPPVSNPLLCKNAALRSSHVDFIFRPRGCFHHWYTVCGCRASGQNLTQSSYTCFYENKPSSEK